MLEKFIRRSPKRITPLFNFTPQRSNYVNAKPKWKKDEFYDQIDILSASKNLRPLLTLKNIIAGESSRSIPIHAVSKQNRRLEISGRVASFLRRYPAVFEEFCLPKSTLPWFRLTKEATDLDCEEKKIYNLSKCDIMDRLRRLIFMSREKRLPLRVVKGMLWFLGIEEDFLGRLEEVEGFGFRVVEMGDEEKGLGLVCDCGGEIPVSVLERNCVMGLSGCDLGMGRRRGVVFPLFPSKGFRLKEKVKVWLEEFQRVEYVSPYEDYSSLDPSSDVSEKRVAGVLHELLSLFVDNCAERRKLLCLKKYLGLPQKFHKVFERHPHVFYLLLKEKTCFVVLKEAYCAGESTAIEKHPLLEVRKKYVQLMHKSEDIIRSRRRSGKASVQVSDVHQDMCINEKSESYPENDIQKKSSEPVELILS